MGGFRDYLRMIMGWWNGTQAEAGGGVCATVVLTARVNATVVLTARVNATVILEAC